MKFLRNSTIRAWLAALMLLPCAGVAARTSPPRPLPMPPQLLFPGLFQAVQMQAVFGDGKAFADAVPKAPPNGILRDYRRDRPGSRAALRRFVQRHFVLPSTTANGSRTRASVPIARRRGLVAHIDSLWNSLTRFTPVAPQYSSLLPLPRPYVVPGGRFRELYYWDSYFTMLGLASSGRRDLFDDMLEDFAFLIDRYGHVPNGTRSYYLSRSQPPFFFAMVALAGGVDPAEADARYLPELRREYAFWMRGAAAVRPGRASERVVRLPDGSILNRYWDDRDTPRDESYRHDVLLARRSRRPPSEVYRDLRAAAESGWDFSSRWFADGRHLRSIDTAEIVPVDLNALLYGLENGIRAGCERRGDHECAREFAARAARRRAAMDRYLWDAAVGAYLDYRWTRRARINRISAATLYPLFVGMASRRQATAVAATVRTQLLAAGGIVTTRVDSGQQWDSPNGWAPLQWIAVAGLRDYGIRGLAGAIACRWIVNVRNVYRRSGKLVEKYDVVTLGRRGGGGEYPLQDGFGWTNGVTRKLIELYPSDLRIRRVADCAAP